MSNSSETSPGAVIGLTAESSVVEGDKGDTDNMDEIGFRLANNKPVTISQDALKIGKQLVSAKPETNQEATNTSVARESTSSNDDVLEPEMDENLDYYSTCISKVVLPNRAAGILALSKLESQDSQFPATKGLHGLNIDSIESERASVTLREVKGIGEDNNELNLTVIRKYPPCYFNGQDVIREEEFKALAAENVIKLENIRGNKFNDFLETAKKILFKRKYAEGLDTRNLLSRDNLSKQSPQTRAAILDEYLLYGSNDEMQSVMSNAPKHEVVGAKQRVTFYNDIIEEKAEKIFQNYISSLKLNCLELNRIRVVDYKNDRSITGIITITNKDMFENINVGSSYRFTHLLTTCQSRLLPMMTASPTTTAEQLPAESIDKCLLDRFVPIQALNEREYTPPVFDEIDLLGVIDSISKYSFNNGQIISLVDENANMVQIHFAASSIQKHELTNVLKKGSVAQFENLKWKISSGQSKTAYPTVTTKVLAIPLDISTRAVDFLKKLQATNRDRKRANEDGGNHCAKRSKPDGPQHL